MKNLLIPFIAALALGGTLPVLAGPDWQAIEHARQAKRIALQGDPDIAKPPEPEAVKCPPAALVLLLDHGPHAQTTLFLNQKRKERHEAQVKTCANAAK